MKKNILITGSSGILGKYLVKKLNKTHNIICISRKERSKKGKLNLNCDLSNESQVNNKLYQIKKKFKKIDAMILCAGKSKKNYCNVENLKSWKNSFDDNFFSTTNIIESYINNFKYQKTKIIVISSVAGSKILADAPITYSVAKSALNFYVKFKSKELAKYKICINTISPGNIMMSGNNWYKNKKKNKRKVLNYIEKNVPLNNFCLPENILGMCKFLLEDKNNSTTGSNFTIDSGQSL